MEQAVEETLGAADQVVLDAIWNGCAGVAPGITAAEVAQLVRRAAPRVRRNADRSPHRYLLTCLFNDLQGPQILAEIRRELEQIEQRAVLEREQCERQRESIREMLADPDTPEERKPGLLKLLEE